MSVPGTTFFDALASSYDRWYETPLGQLVDRLEREAVFALVHAGPGDLALDLSCGTGHYALRLARRGLRVVGVDLSDPMLRLARAKAVREGVRLSVAQADGSALPFSAGAFDLVTLILGIEFVRDPRQALEEIRRVLKPGGCLVVAILNRSGLWNLWRRFKRVFGRSVWRLATFLSIEELRGLIDAEGFQQLGWRGAVHFLPIFGWRAVRHLERWEAFGERWMPGRATFVAVAARRI